jgi:hypothetical protein
VLYENQDQRMIDYQAQLITTLRTELKSYQAQYKEKCAEVERMAPSANFYAQMQEAILQNPILQGEWDRFCSFLKMALDDATYFS